MQARCLRRCRAETMEHTPIVEDAGARAGTVGVRRGFFSVVRNFSRPRTSLVVATKNPFACDGSSLAVGRRSLAYDAWVDVESPAWTGRPATSANRAARHRQAARQQLVVC